MEQKIERRGRKAGTKFSDIVWKHTNIYCSREQWDKLNYLSAPSGKTLSTWLVDKVLEYDGVVPVLEKDTTSEYGARPLCVDEKKWNEIKARAESAGVAAGKYVLSIALLT